MKDIKRHLYFSFEEQRILVEALNDLRTFLINEGRYTDCVDELLYKVLNAKIKRVKIIYV